MHSKSGVKNSKIAKMEENIIKGMLANLEERNTIEKGYNRKLSKYV